MKAPWVLGTALVVTGVLSGSVLGVYIWQALTDARGWFLHQFWLGALLYVALFSLAAVLLLPFSPFCMAIGYIWGVPTGFAVQSAGILVSSAVVFVISRGCLKSRVDAWLSETNGQWKDTLDRIGADLWECSRLNLLLCFIPMPYGTHAYVFGLSECPFWCFVVVFQVGMTGHTFLNLAIGHAAWLAASGDAPSAPGDQDPQILLFAGSALLTTLAICYGIVIARRYVSETYIPDTHGIVAKAPESP